MATSEAPTLLVFVEADDDGFIVVPDWAAEAMGLAAGERRLAMYPDGRIDLAHRAGPDAEVCRVPEGWPDAGPTPGA